MLNETELSNNFTGAIRNDNVAEVYDIVINHKNIKFFFRNNQYFIGLAYANKKLDVAEILIKNGAIFNVKLLFTINEFSCDQLHYINKIKPYIPKLQYEAAVNLVSTYGCKNQLNQMIVIKTGSCINIDQYLYKYTVSNIEHKSHILQYYKNLQDSSSALVIEIIKGVVGLSYNMYGPFIIMPVGTRNYFDAANINRENQPGLIYLPTNNYDKEEQSYMLHEFNHYLLNGLPGFKGCAYFDEDSRKHYEKAAKEMLLNVFKIFNTTIENYHEIVNNELFSLKLVVSFLINNTDINLFTHIHHTDNAVIKNLAVKQYISNDTMPDFNRDVLLSNYLLSYMTQKNISKDESYLLARIGEFTNRPEEQFCKELIVRLPELEVYGINSETLKIFDPLREYWTKYISPKIQEVIKALPVSFCDAEQSYKVTPSGDAVLVEREVEIAGNNAVEHEGL